MIPAVHARFYSAALDADGDRLVLEEEEARHLSRVLRLAAGAEIQVFDGRGLERAAIVEHIGRDQVMLRLGRRVEAARELPFALTLVQAVLKGDAMDGVVRDSTMLGAAVIQPVTTARCEVPAAARSRAGRRERWQRIAISSAKQCGRAVVPDVLETVPLGAVLTRAREGLAVLLTEPSSGAGAGRPEDLPRPSDRPVRIIVGPEGGWAPEELEQAAAAGARFVTLGHRTLRADVAATVALPVLLYEWGAL